MIARDITDRKRAEESAKARFRMVDAATTKSSEELMQIALDEIEVQTGSSIGFFHFILPDQETIALQTWSTNTLNSMCTAEGQYSHYPISQGGVWSDCIRQRGPVIHNDYVSLPHRKGMPEGHAQVVRELTFPIIRNDRIVAAMGVGNKKTDYNATDVEVALLLGDFSWELIERKRAEEALRESEELYRSVFKDHTAVKLLIDPDDGSIIEANEAAIQFYGWSHEQLQQMKIQEINTLSPEDVKKEMEDARSGKRRYFEFRHRRADESIRDVEVFSSMIREKGKGLLQSDIHDITERKLAEKVLRESEERFRLLVENAPEAIYIQTQGNFAYVNQAAVRLFRAISPDQLLGQPILSRVHPDYQEIVRERIRLINEERREISMIEQRCLKLDGTFFYAEVSAVPFLYEGQKGALVFCRDITERKRAEEKLHELAQRLSHHVDHSPLAVIEWGPDMRLIRWSNEAERIFGWRAEEVLGKRMEDFRWIYEEDQAEVAEVSTDLTNGTNPQRFSSNRNYCKDGTVIHCEWYNSSLLDESDKLRSILSQVLDITERKQAEEALRGSEANLVRAQSISHLANWELDIETEKVQGSEELYRLFNLAADFTLGAYVEKFHPDDRAYVVDSINAAIHEGKPYSIDYRIIPRADDIRYVHAQGEAAYDKAGLPIKFFGIVQDITERKQAEERIKSLLKEKELLLREVHHRLKNNMLVMMALVTLQSKTLKTPEAVAALADIRGRLQSQYVLYDKLYRKDNLKEMSTTDYIPALVNKIIDTFPDQASIKIETHVDEFLLGVETIFPLGIIINELLTNSMKYAFIGRDEGLIIVSATNKDHRVTLAIEDNGIGLPESIDLKTSCGFGLKLVGMLTSQLRGTIMIEREKGTRFILEFKI